MKRDNELNRHCYNRHTRKHSSQIIIPLHAGPFKPIVGVFSQIHSFFSDRTPQQISVYS